MSNDKPTEIISWDENGRIVSELSIRNGKRSGIILDWYDDGAKKSELVYKDDQLVKKTFWDTDGYVLYNKKLMKHRTNIHWSSNLTNVVL